MYIGLDASKFTARAAEEADWRCRFSMAGISVAKAE